VIVCTASAQVWYAPQQQSVQTTPPVYNPYNRYNEQPIANNTGTVFSELVSMWERLYTLDPPTVPTAIVRQQPVNNQQFWQPSGGGVNTAWPTVPTYTRPWQQSSFDPSQQFVTQQTNEWSNIQLATGAPVHNNGQSNAQQYNFTCARTCMSGEDCNGTQSCFGARADTKGCCLQLLMPNQTNCLIDEQCSRSCTSSHCDLTQVPSRCLCDSDRLYLFKKCWKHCPDFSEPSQSKTNFGHRECRLTVGRDEALRHLHRIKRQQQGGGGGRVFC